MKTPMNSRSTAATTLDEVKKSRTVSKSRIVVAIPAAPPGRFRSRTFIAWANSVADTFRSTRWPTRSISATRKDRNSSSSPRASATPSASVHSVTKARFGITRS